ncbi:DNA replication protein DnaC [Clostridium acetireducens DSM 10703]|uniref:DNA replication protein DnaC n=1 Tax=Clostridium acetireducens DSM 10703 TaxID=1121290 RepID=A0A1E8EZN5_9CLOT|nr:ATP-binding protein [Clostridium acetireducens]OFI06627.1 DNA replication protein DnaC [Clostridium acetireducens DSM 10703]
MIKVCNTEIAKLYEDIRNKKEKELIDRRNLIKKKLPEVLEIENQIKKLCINLSINILRNTENKDIYLKKLKEKITNLRIRKSELLVSNGYSIDFLDIHYECSKCKDTGYIGTKKCICYNHKMIQLYYKNSDLKDILKKNNFSNFNFNYFSPVKWGECLESPRKNIENIVSKMWTFIENFSNSIENFLFYGNSGTGKTFLSHCIAKEILDRGYLVVYRTSDNLLQDLKEIKFRGNEYLNDMLINCDLLIIDDLGSEQINDFSKTELFNFLNKKLLKRKKMIISTNFSLEDILKNYSERISSRIIGDFNLCKFYGEDIRINKNINKN